MCACDTFTLCPSCTDTPEDPGYDSLPEPEPYRPAVNGCDE